MEWVQPIASVVLVIVIPFLVTAATASFASSLAKQVLAITASILGGVVAAVLGGIPTPGTLVVYILAVIGGVQVAYTAFKAIGVNNKWLDLILSFKKGE